MPLHKCILAVFAMMLLGLSAVVSKIGLQEFSPMLFLLLRFCSVLPALYFIPRPKISWWMLAAITISISIAHLGLANVGLAMGASAGTYVLILQTGSLFAIFFAFLFYGHKPSKFDLIGIFIGLMGVCWICSEKGSEGSIIALAALLGSAITWGLGFTLVKKSHESSLSLSVWSSILLIPIMIVICGIFEGPEAAMTSIYHASITGWSTVFFTGWVGMLGAGGILMYLMQTEQVSKVVPYNTLLPVFGCLASYLILGETLSPAMLLGGLWIVLSLLVMCFGQLGMNQLKKIILKHNFSD